MRQREGHVEEQGLLAAGVFLDLGQGALSELAVDQSKRREAVELDLGALLSPNAFEDPLGRRDFGVAPLLANP